MKTLKALTTDKTIKIKWQKGEIQSVPNQRYVPTGSWQSRTVELLNLMMAGEKIMKNLACIRVEIYQYFFKIF
jgi:hypothetical protein